MITPSQVHWEFVPSHWCFWVELFLAEFILQPQTPRLSGLDSFAGQKQMARSFLEIGMAMATYEVLDDAVLENCLSLHGQQNFLQKLVQVSLEKDGLCWMGPPCSWWTWISRSAHQRTKERPQGHVAHPTVAFHNAIAQFVADAIMTCIALGVHFVLEQPLTSVLPDFEAVRTALTEAHAKSIVIPLWKFGASSHKPLKLWGTAPWLTQLSNVADKISATQASSSQLANDQSRPGQIHIPRPTCTLALVGENGQVNGIRADMAASSSYPACFCDVVAFLHNTHLKSLASRKAAMVLVSILGRQHPELRKRWFVEGLLVFL